MPFEVTAIDVVTVMAIQFACPSCQQPIEIDDQHADQMVTCPFCNAVVRAPRESTLNVANQAPKARAADDAFRAPPPPSPTGAPYPSGIYAPGAAVEATAPNPFGRASVICGVAAWLLVLVGVVLMTPIVKESFDTLRAEYGDQLKNMDDEKLNEAVRETMRDQLLNNEDHRVRAAVAMLVVVLAELSGIGGIVLGLVGMTRRGMRRSPSGWGLLVSLLFLPGQCFASVLIFGMTAAH